MDNSRYTSANDHIPNSVDANYSNYTFYGNHRLNNSSTFCNDSDQCSCLYDQKSSASLKVGDSYHLSSSGSQSYVNHQWASTNTGNTPGATIYPVSGYASYQNIYPNQSDKVKYVSSTDSRHAISRAQYQGINSNQDASSLFGPTTVRTRSSAVLLQAKAERGQDQTKISNADHTKSFKQNSSGSDLQLNSTSLATKIINVASDSNLMTSMDTNNLVERINSFVPNKTSSVNDLTYSEHGDNNQRYSRASDVAINIAIHQTERRNRFVSGSVNVGVGSVATCDQNLYHSGQISTFNAHPSEQSSSAISNNRAETIGQSIGHDTIGSDNDSNRDHYSRLSTQQQHLMGNQGDVFGSPETAANKSQQTANGKFDTRTIDASGNNSSLSAQTKFPASSRTVYPYFNSANIRGCNNDSQFENTWPNQVGVREAADRRTSSTQNTGYESQPKSTNTSHGGMNSGARQTPSNYDHLLLNSPPSESLKYGGSSGGTGVNEPFSQVNQSSNRQCADGSSFDTPASLDNPSMSNYVGQQSYSYLQNSTHNQTPAHFPAIY